MAAVAAAIDHRMNERKREDLPARWKGWRRVAFERERIVRLERAQTFDVSRSASDDGATLALDISAAGETPRAVRVSSTWAPGDPIWRGSVDSASIAVMARPILNGVALSHAGASANARVFTRREAELAALMLGKAKADTGNRLLCPMPGLVKSIAVAVGQEIKAGEPLCIVEAMKMENVLSAERDATVAKILCKAGDTLAVDAVIMEFAALDRRVCAGISITV